MVCILREWFMQSFTGIKWRLYRRLENMWVPNNQTEQMGPALILWLCETRHRTKFLTNRIGASEGGDEG